MANEFIARNGLIAQNNSVITGSLTVTGGVTGSFSGSITSASYASTASFVTTAQTASYVLQAVSSSFASTASFVKNAQTASYLNTLNQDLTFNGNLTLNGTASVQYLITVYETASTVYSSGSNQLGDATNDTQTLIGRTIVSGSLEITGSTTSTLGFTGSLQGTASWAQNTSQIVITNDADIRLVTANGNSTLDAESLLTFDGTKLSLLYQSGDEGGEILLNKSATNNTLTGSGITIDSFQNKLRFFEQGGAARGAYIDLTSCAGGVGTNLLSPGGGTTFNGGTNVDNRIVTATGTSPELNGEANLQFDGSTLNVTGSVVVSQNINASSFTGSLLGTAATASYYAPEYVSASLAADVTMPVSNNWYDGPSVSLTGGTWYVTSHITQVRTATTAESIYFRITDGTTHYASTQGYHPSVVNGGVTSSPSAIITLNSTTTIKIQVATSAGATTSLIKAALQVNGSGNNATMIKAIRLA